MGLAKKVKVVEPSWKLGPGYKTLGQGRVGMFMGWTVFYFSRRELRARIIRHVLHDPCNARMFLSTQSMFCSTFQKRIYY